MGFHPHTVRCREKRVKVIKEERVRSFGWSCSVEL